MFSMDYNIHSLNNYNIKINKLSSNAPNNVGIILNMILINIIMDQDLFANYVKEIYKI